MTPTQHLGVAMFVAVVVATSCGMYRQGREGRAFLKAAAVVLAVILWLLAATLFIVDDDGVTSDHVPCVDVEAGR